MTLSHVAVTIFITAIFMNANLCTGNNEGWIIQILTYLDTIIKNGYPAANIPKLDPMYVKKDLYSNNTMLRGNIDLEGQISGFSNYFVKQANVDSNLFFHLNLVFVSTTFNGSYNLNATGYNDIVPLVGSGPISIYFSYIDLAINGTLVGKNQMLQLSNFNFGINEINAVEVKAEGLLKEYGLDEVLEPSLRGLLNTGAKLFKEKCDNIVRAIVMSDGNLELRKVDMSSVLEVLKSELFEV